MFGDVDLPVMLIVDLSLASVVQHSPFQFHALAYTVQVISVPELSFRSRSKFNSLLTEMITPQTHTCIYKTASCPSCIRGSLRLAPNYVYVIDVSNLHMEPGVSVQFG